jgi:hypothetical protein
MSPVAELLSCATSLTLNRSFFSAMKTSAPGRADKL